MAKKPFKHVFGKRVVIESFVKDVEEESKSKIELLAETKKQVEQEKRKNELVTTEKFKVLQVGDCENKELKPGVEIYIEDPHRNLAPENVQSIIENGKILGFIVPERVIAGIF